MGVGLGLEAGSSEAGLKVQTKLSTYAVDPGHRRPRLKLSNCVRHNISLSRLGAWCSVLAARPRTHPRPLWSTACAQTVVCDNNSQFKVASNRETHK